MKTGKGRLDKPLWLAKVTEKGSAIRHSYIEKGSESRMDAILKVMETTMLPRNVPGKTHGVIGEANLAGVNVDMHGLSSMSFFGG